MSTPFTPGELTGPQARALNELARVAEQFSRLTVAAPLSLTRPAGIPAIRVDDIGGMDIFLVEITGNSGTPPVHTGKRKTRDTSNNVIDLSPEVDYTQILNPLETAWPDGTLVAIFPIPEYKDWWWGIPIDTSSGPLPPGVPCEPAGWLADRQALIDMATATPKKVLTYKILKAATVTGIADGRCDQCMTEQGDDATAIPYPLTAFYDSVKGRWVGSVLVNYCCGCARLEIDIIEDDGDVDDDIPRVKAWLYLIDPACDASGRTQIPLHIECYTKNTVIFSGAGPALCNGVVPFPCDNAFYVIVKCEDCDMNVPECDLGCQESCAPPLYKIDTTGLFTGADAAYSGIWYLPYISDCTWRITCGTITITLTITHTDGYTGDTTITVTFGGVAVYHHTALGEHLACFDTMTLDRDSGDPALTPATIDVVPVYCETCPAFDCLDWSQTLKVSASSDDVPCINGWTKNLIWKIDNDDPDCGGVQWYENNDTPPCTTDTGFAMTCCRRVSDGRVYLVAAWNGCELTLVSVVTSPFAITWTFTGTCGIYTGTITFVVTEQP